MTNLSTRAVFPGPAREDGAPQSRNRRHRLASAHALGYVAPTWLFMIAIGLIPVGYAVWMSLTSQDLASTSPSFVGFDNYIRGVFTRQFLEALGVTLAFVVIGLVIQFVLGYLLAVCLHRQLRGFQIARTILLIPMLLTPVVVGLIWQFMFNPDLGIINAMFQLVGVDVNWLADSTSARAVVILVDSWMHIPFVMLMVVAGMSGLPQEPMEAAAIDGAGWWKTTRYIVLPMLKPILTIALLVRCVDIARLFDIIYATTQGGPGTATQSVSLVAYNATFLFYQFGPGAAMAVALGLIMFPVYFFYLKLTKI